MTLNEKVIKEWEAVLSRDPLDTPWDLIDETIELLKEQEAKQGKWIPVTNGRCGMECSICHDYAPSFSNGSERLSLYCPNCGAKMKAVKWE